MATEKKFGVVLASVDEKILAKYVKKLNLTPGGEEVSDSIKVLANHFRTTEDKANLVKCDCGGVFPISYKECPFCGDQEGEEDEDSDGDEEGDTEVAPTPEPAPEPANGKKGKAAKAAIDSVIETLGEEVKEPKTAKPAKESKPAKEPKAAKAEIVPVVDDALVGLTSTDLDNATSEVLRLKGNSSFSMWELGSKLREIHERQLWKLRMDDKGKAVYRSFEAYCATEAKMSGTACYGLIKIAENYTPEKVRELGTSKLNLILKAPVEDREELERQAAGGESKEALRKKVAELREKKGAPPAKAPKVARGGAPPAGKGRKSEHITIVNVLGKKSVLMYRKPAKKGEDPVEVVCPEAVKNWLAENMPYGIDDLGNGVREVFVLAVDTKGRLQVRIDRKRLDEG